jgi:transcriptional regulator with XRE-family HTH domain
MNSDYTLRLAGQKFHQLTNGEKSNMALDTFGKRVRVLRVDRGLSQIDLRDRMEKLGVGIGETYVSELERTSKMPSLEVAAAMARVLDVSVDYLSLLIDDALPYRRQPQPDPYLSPEADEVAQIVDAMHPSQRQLLLGVAKSMVSAPTRRQGERAEMRDTLDSIEKRHGIDVRRKVEKLMRELGLLLDDDI